MNSSLRKILTIAALLILWLPNYYSQSLVESGYSISGTIKLKNWPQYAQPGFKIRATNTSNSSLTYDSQPSADNGTFTISGVPNGSYNLSVLNSSDYFTTFSPTNPLTINGANVSNRNISITGKATPSVRIDAPTNFTAGTPFDVTVYLKNTNYAVSTLKGYLDISFPENPTVSVTSSTGWNSVTKFTQGQQIYHATNGAMSALYPLVSGEWTGTIGFNVEKAITIRVTPPANASSIKIYYRGTIADVQDPVTSGASGGTRDQQGWIVKYVTVTKLSAPDAPTATNATNVTLSSFTANWNSVSSATSYRLDVSTSSSFGSFVSGYNNLDVGNVTSKSVTGLNAGTNYYYRVRAVNSAGTSGHSNTKSVTTTSNSYSISGTIKFKNWPQYAQPGFKIRATNTSNSSQTYTSQPSADNGAFTISGVPNGSYDLSVETSSDYFTTFSPTNPLTINGANVSNRNISITGKATPSVRIDAPTNFTAGTPFDVTVYLKNTNYAVSTLKGYLDISFPDNPSVSVTSSTGWNSVTKFTQGQQINHATNGVMSALYPLVSGEWTGTIGFNVEKEIIIRVTPPANASSIKIYYRGTIADVQDPVTSGASGGTRDQQGWIVYEKVVTSQSGVSVTINNIPGGSTSLPGNNGIARLYDANGNSLNLSANTNNGVATFNNLNFGNYIVEGYHNPTNPGTEFGEEYWGRTAFSHNQNTTPVTLTRNMPHFDGVKVFNHITGQDVTGQTVAAGVKLRVLVFAKNPSSSQLNVKARVIVDKNKQSDFDFDELSPSVVSQGNNGICTLTVLITPTTSGDYYGIAGIQTNVSGNNYTTTDGTIWVNDKWFSVTGNMPTVFGYTVLVHGYHPSGDKLEETTKNPETFDPIYDYWEEGNIKIISGILERMGGGMVYLYDRNTASFIDVTEPDFEIYRNENKEKILVFNWGISSNDDVYGHAEAAAEALFVGLINSQFLNVTNPNANKSFHFIGHSRGTVVVSECIQRMGCYQIPISYVTSLDPHDFNEDDVPEDANFQDPAVQIWDKVKYADNFYNIPSGWQPFNPSGRSLAQLESNSLHYNRNLSALPSMGHTEVKDYYFGTIKPEAVTQSSWYTAVGGAQATGFSLWLDRGGHTYDGAVNGFNSNKPKTNPTTLANLVPYKFSPDDPDDNDYASPYFFNGDFNWGKQEDLFSSLVGGKLAGWSYNGGGGDGHIEKSNGWNHLELDHWLGVPPLSEANLRTHNWFYVPNTATGLEFSYGVNKQSSGTPPNTDVFKVIIEEYNGSSTVALNYIYLNQTTPWIHKYIDLTNYRNKVVKITFKIEPDGQVDSEVWLKDIVLNIPNINSFPVTPSAVQPVEGAIVQTLTPNFEWSAYQHGGDLNPQAGYQIRVREDSDNDRIVYETGFISATTGNTHTYSPGSYTGTDPVTGDLRKSEALKWGKQYHWHVRYRDASGDWSGWSHDDPNPHQSFLTANGTITTSVPSLASFGNIIVGECSGVVSYTVSALGLNSNLLISSPAHFQISLSNSSGFTNELSITPVNGNIATTTIYIKFCPTAVGTFSENIVHTSDGATSVNVAVSGNGVNPSIFVTSPSGGENWRVGSQQNITWSIGPANAKSLNNGGYLQATPLKALKDDGEETKEKLLTENSGLSFGEAITNVKIEYSTNNGTSWSIVVPTTPASGGSFPWTIPNTPSTQCVVRVSDAQNPAITGTSGVFQIAQIVSEITVSTAQLDNFGSLIVNTTSTAKNYSVSGTNLSGPIDINAPAGFAVSLTENGTYTQTLQLQAVSGSVPSTQIFVKFTPQAVQSYTDNITHSSTGAATKSIQVSGTGIAQPQLIFNVQSVSFGNIFVSQCTTLTYTVTGNSLAGNVTVGVAAPFQVAVGGSNNWTNSLVLSHSNGSLNAQVDVRFCPTVQGPASSSIVHTTDLIPATNLPVTGSGIPIPNLTVTSPAAGSVWYIGSQVTVNWEITTIVNSRGVNSKGNKNNSALSEGGVSGNQINTESGGNTSEDGGMTELTSLYNIELSRDNGSNWEVIGNNVSGLTHPWTVSGTASQNCKIKVTDAQNPAITGTSGVFQIAQAPQAITVNAKIVLHGPYNPATGVMNNSGILTYIPPTQPYSVAPWNYTGNETVTSVPAQVMDWVLLELRTGTAASTMVARRAAFVRTDGQLVGLDGTQLPSFTGVQPGNYYVVVRHRNHLGIMTASSIALSASSPLYDFTTGLSKAYGLNPMIDCGNGVFGLISGDGDASGGVAASDRNLVWRPQNGQAGYKSGDYDLSGGVGSIDRNSKWRVNNGKSSQIPN